MSTEEEEGKEIVPENGGPREDTVIEMMDGIIHKLYILDYEKEMTGKKNFTPFKRHHFAIQDENVQSQFKSMMDLITFLMKKCNQDFTIDKYDDANTSVNILLLSLKAMNFNLDFPPAKLKQAYGEEVCNVLNFLINKALQVKGFIWKKPDYPKENFADEAEADDAALVEDEDEVPVEEEDEVLYEEVIYNKVGIDALEDSTKQIIESTVDPIAWKKELERVTPKLKVKVKEETGKEWRLHIEQTTQHDQTIEKVFPPTESSLKQIGEKLKEAMDRVLNKERYINSQFDTLRQEYHGNKEKLNFISKRCKEINEQVNEMTNELSSLNDQVNEIQSHMDDRGSTMTDTSPLVKIKAALQTLKAEIKSLDLKVGVSGYGLMQANLKQGHSRLSPRKRNKEPTDDSFSDEEI